MSEIRKGIFFATLDRYAAFIVNFISIVILSRLLTPKETGLYSIAAALINIAQSLRSFGVYPYILQEKDLTDEKLGSAVGVSLLLGCTLSALFTIAARPIAIFYGNPGLAPLLMILSANFILVAYTAVGNGVLTRNMRFRSIMVISIASTLANAVVSGSMAAIGFGAAGLAWGSLAGIGMTLAGNVRVLGRQAVLRPNLRHYRSVFHFGMFSSASGILGELSTRTPDLLIGRLVSLEGAGLFSRGTGLVNSLAALVTGAAQPVAASIFARIHRENANLEATYLQALSYASIVAWPSLGLLAVLAQPVTMLCFGRQWLPSVPVAQVLCAGAAVGLVGMLAQTLLGSIGAVRQNFLIQSVAVPIYIATVAVGATIDLTAAAIGSVVSGLIISILSVAILRRLIMLRVTHLMTVLRPAVVATLACAAGALAVVSIIGPSPYTLFPAGAVAFVVWLASIRLLNHPVGHEIGLLAGYLGLLGKTRKAAPTVTESGSAEATCPETDRTKVRRTSHSFICLNNDGYDGLRRPRHILMGRLARMGFSVLFVSSAVSYVSQRLSRRDLKFGGVQRIRHGFYWYQPPVLLPNLNRKKLGSIIIIIRILLLRLTILLLTRKNKIYFISVPDSDYIRLLRGKKNCRVIYNVHDRFVDSGGNWFDGHDELIKRADLVLCSSVKLFAEHQGRSDKPIVFFPPGVDFDVFPSEWKFRPRHNEDFVTVGCIGSLGTQFDWALLLSLADLLKSYRFHFIGPIVKRARLNPSFQDLENRPNVTFFGEVSHHRIPGIIDGFDVCIMPYALNRFSEGVNPLKMLEYMAMGKPIVSSAIPAVQQFEELLYVASGTEEWVDCLRRAVVEDNEEMFRARRRVALSEDYEARVALLLQLLGLSEAT